MKTKEIKEIDVETNKECLKCKDKKISPLTDGFVQIICPSICILKKAIKEPKETKEQDKKVA